ncbi:MAG: hypothetical protein NC311_16520, partial [Muribaculaceae bacterium]|nr:hypothetical protein [Muribaculaceae bacterium]
FTQGEYEQVVTIAPGGDATLYIDVCSQDEYLSGDPQSMKPWVYTLQLERATDDRRLDNVTILVEESGLNGDEDIQCITDSEVVNATMEMEVELAAATLQVALDVTTIDDEAYVQLFNLNDDGTFGEPITFYTASRPAGAGSYAYDLATKSFVPAENGDYVLVSEQQKRITSTYIYVGDGNGSYVRKASGNGYDRVVKGQGDYIRYDVTMDFPLTEDVLYIGIRVSNLPNGADQHPSDYVLIVTRKDNTFQLQQVALENRKGKEIATDGVQLAIDEATGDLIVVGSVVDQVEQTIKDRNAQRRKDELEGTITTEDEEYGLVNTMSTVLIPAGSTVIPSEASHDAALERDGWMHFFKTMKDGNKSEYAAMLSKNATLFTIDIPSSTNAVGRLQAILEDPSRYFVDAGRNMTFSAYSDAANVDLLGMEIGDTRFYPILVSSTNAYKLSDGTKMYDEMHVVVLQINMVDALADLDLKIFTAENPSAGYTAAKAKSGDDYETKEDLTTTLPGLGLGNDETVYNYYALINTFAQSVHVKGVAGSDSTMVGIYDPTGKELHRHLGQAVAIRTVEINQITYVYFVAEAADGRSHKVYKLELRRNSDNADLKLVAARNNLGWSSGGDVSSGSDKEGVRDSSTDTGGHYNVQLPGVTYITDLHFVTDEPTATIEFKTEDGWTKPVPGEYIKPRFETGGAQKTTVTVRVTAPNGFQKVYDVDLLNGGVNTDLKLVRLGKTDKTQRWANIDAADGGLRAYESTVNIMRSGDDDEDAYVLIPFYLEAVSTRATIKLRDPLGENLNFVYVAGGVDVDGMSLDESIKKNNGVPVTSEISWVLDSSDNLEVTTGGSGATHVLTGELLMKKTNLGFPLEIVVTADNTSSVYTWNIVNRQTDFSDLVVRIAETTRMMMDSAGDFRYVKPVEKTVPIGGGASYYDPDNLEGLELYYVGKRIVTDPVSGATNGEKDGLIYRLLPDDIRYAELISSRTLYYEVVYDVSQTSVNLGATFSNLADKLRGTETSFTLDIGRADQDNQSKGTFSYVAPNTFKVSTLLPNRTDAIELTGDPAKTDLFTTNPAVNIFGAETRVPITVTLGGEEQVFYAVIRKNALDQWLDFIRVDDKDLELNRTSFRRPNAPVGSAATSILTASTVVYNSTRSAVIQIQSSETTSHINMARERYKVYVRDNAGNLVWEDATYDSEGNVITEGTYNPGGVNDPLFSTAATGLLTFRASSLNDGMNYFYITVTPISGSYPPRDYLLAINYVNLDVYLDDMRVFNVINSADPENDTSDYVPFTNKDFHRSILDYRFNYSMSQDNKGKLRIDATAATSHDALQAHAKKFYPDYYKAQVTDKYRVKILEILRSDADLVLLERAGSLNLENETELILQSRQAELAPAVRSSDTYTSYHAKVLQKDDYPDTIAKEAEALSDDAIKNEIVIVTVGKPDELTYTVKKDSGATVRVSANDLQFKGAEMATNAAGQTVFYAVVKYFISGATFTSTVRDASGAPVEYATRGEAAAAAE